MHVMNSDLLMPPIGMFTRPDTDERGFGLNGLRPGEHEQLLQHSPQRYAEMVRTISGHGVLLMDRQGVIRSWNRGAERITGMREDQMLGRAYPLLFTEEAVRDGVPGRALDFARSHGHCRDEHRRRTVDGRTLLVDSSIDPLRRADGELSGYVEVFEDITERKQREQELYERATRDALTGVANRGHFMALAAQEIERARRFAEPLSVLLIDVDHFKKINDEHGHDTGDRALVTLARFCQQNTRRIDTVGRLGGEEFAILMPRADKEPALEAAQRLRLKLAEQRINLGVGGRQLGMTVSGGVAAIRSTVRDAQQLLRNADAALYQAKRGGRNAVHAWFE